MIKSNKDMYDAIIIGAGIGGLVCGCYLARAGMKVLIAEQHHKPGGYCTSFKRKGFTFDAAAHSFGGYREDGIIRRILRDLKIYDLPIRRYDPSDVIITPNYRVCFWSDINRTIDELSQQFPEEKNGLTKFFQFIIKPTPMFLVRMRSWTFKQMLDQYFKNERLKSIISFPLLGDAGLPPSMMGAFIACKVLQEYLLDGGYYPEGGMQALPDALSERFREYGGELKTSCRVMRILVSNNNVVEGITTEEGAIIKSKYVVSNCCVRQTFLRMLDKDIVKKEFINKIKDMIQSLSLFMVYVGIDSTFEALPEEGVNLWVLRDYDLDRVYTAAKKGDIRYVMVRVSPDRRSVVAYANVGFKSKKYWEVNKAKCAEAFIDLIEKEAIPDLSKHIVYTDAATPNTLYRYTLNYKGAAYGWAPIPSQMADPDFKKPSFVHGLYLCGHWQTLGLGIPGVAYLGYDTAHLLIKKEKKRDNV